MNGAVYWKFPWGLSIWLVLHINISEGKILFVTVLDFWKFDSGAIDIYNHEPWQVQKKKKSFFALKFLHIGRKHWCFSNNVGHVEWSEICSTPYPLTGLWSKWLGSWNNQNYMSSDKLSGTSHLQKLLLGLLVSNLACD